MKQLPMSAKDFVLLNDAYDGTGGFLDGKYLTPHKRETTENYDKRRELSFYLNYVQVVINSHVNAVFAKSASRTYDESNAYYPEFIKDVDGVGSSINRWMKSVALKAKLFGCVLVVVDNYADQPEDMQTAIDERKYPYVYAIDPSRIHDWTVDEVGRLTSVTYTENYVVKGKNTVAYRTWDTNGCVLKGEKGEVFETRPPHDLGILPCYFMYGFENPKGNVVPVSEFLQVARANKALFNICSEIREIQRHQGFNILTIQGDAPTNKKSVGTENALYYSSSVSNAPAYIAPDASPLEMLSGFMDRLISEIYRMSCVTYTQQYATNQSGESKKWTFHITKQVLEDFAANCEYAEMKMGDIFEKYTQQALNLEVNYNRKYGVEDIESDIAKAQAALDLNISSLAEMEIKKQVARAYFAELPDDEIVAIIDNIEAEKVTEDVNKDADKDIVDAAA